MLCHYGNVTPVSHVASAMESSMVTPVSGSRKTPTILPGTVYCHSIRTFLVHCG